METVLTVISSTPNFGFLAGLGTTGGASRFTLECYIKPDEATMRDALEGRVVAASRG